MSPASSAAAQGAFGGGGASGWIPGQTIAQAFMASAMPVPSPQERSPIRASGDDGFCLLRPGNRITRFTKLPPPPQVLDSLQIHQHHLAADKMALDLGGLWCAPYGSHGLEIIHLSVDAPTGPASSALSAETTAVSASTSNHRKPLSQGEGGGGSGRSVSLKTASSSASVCTSRPATDTDVEDDVDDSDGSQASDETDGFAEFLGTTDKEADDSEADAAAAADATVNSRTASALQNPSSVVTEEARARCSSNATVNNCQECDINQGDEDIDDDAPPLPRYPHLFGVKVTGDANVPAGKVSFAVDMEKVCDIDQELEADSRPVVLFVPGGAVMANLSNRRASMSMWRKARGQINRTPGRWCPEWVDVDFVAYEPGARCQFSVVFKQPSVAVRVLIDFERVLGPEAEWPQWPSNRTENPCF